MSEKKENTNQPEAAKQEGKEEITGVSVEQILSAYPIDREKCRDVVLVEMSKTLARIAVSLEAISQGLIVANTHLTKMNEITKLKDGI